MEWIVYAVCSKKHGMVYVGSTNRFESRVRNHVTRILSGNHPHHGVAKHFASHSAEDIYIRILERMQCEGLGRSDELLIAEQRWLDELGAVNANTVKRSLADLGIEVIDEAGTKTKARSKRHSSPSPASQSPAAE